MLRADYDEMKDKQCLLNCSIFSNLLICSTWYVYGFSSTTLMQMLSVCKLWA